MHPALILWSALLSLPARAASLAPAFEANLGQGPGTARYLARAADGPILIEDTGAHWPRHKVTLRWYGASRNPPPQAWQLAQPTLHTANYCNRTPALCRTPIPSYQRLTRTNLYPNIDWVIYGHDRHLEYDLVIRPGASPDSLRLAIHGASARIDPQGRLIAGNLTQRAPQAYQWINGRKRLVPATWKADNHTFRIAVAAYRKDLPLIIDPVVESAAVTGGTEDDIAVGAISYQPSFSADPILFRYGVTSSAEWTAAVTPAGRDVFVEVSRGQAVSRTVWGGEGDESVSSATLLNDMLYIAGWTTSRNPPRPPPRWGRPYSQPAGGPSDGFILRVGSGVGVESTFIGGPGADRLYAAVPVMTSSGEVNFLLAGETDDAAWPSTTFTTRTGPGGGFDAFVALWDAGSYQLHLMGGAADDRASKLRQSATGDWWVAGETSSADFPAGTPAGGLDTWFARFTPDGTWPMLQRFGGPGDDRLSGLALQPEEGALFLAGTSNSPQLPAQTGGYHGGDTDGFLAAFDSDTGEPRFTNWIGGTGSDEVNSLEPARSTLLLAGATDSPSLTFPGLEPGSARGGRDGLFLITDASGQPLRAFRTGGAGDDRLLHAQPAGLGRALLSGSTASAEWIREVAPTAVWAGNADAFTLQLAYAEAAVAPVLLAPPRLGPRAASFISVDAQQPYSIRAAFEPGLDGILRVRSLQPEKLLVASAADLPGEAQIVLTGTDGTTPRDFYVQALSSGGEADIVIEGRSLTPGVFLPLTRIRLRLTRLGGFWDSTEPHILTQGAPPRVFLAAVLPDGSPGYLQFPRPGITFLPAIASSDATGLTMEAGLSANRGVWTVIFRSTRADDYTAIVSAAGRSDALSEARRILTDPISRQPTIPRSIQLPQYHSIVYPLGFRFGDRIVATSNDPDRLRFGPDATLTTVTLRPETLGSLTVAALGEGDASFHLEGSLDGIPVDLDVKVRLVPVTVSLTTPTPIMAGNSFIGIATYRMPPNTPPIPDTLRPVPIPAILQSPVRISNSSVMRYDSLFDFRPAFWFTALSPGATTVEFGAEEFGFRSEVTVIPAGINFDVSPELLVPAGTIASVLVSDGLPPERLAATRLRLNRESTVFFAGFGAAPREMTIPLRAGSGFLLSARDAKPGDRASLFASAPGIDESETRIRVTELVFVPEEPNRAVTASPDAEVLLSYRPAPWDGTRLLPAYHDPRLQLDRTFRFRVAASPLGICTFPETVNGPGILARCPNPGTVTVALHPIGEGVASVQPQFLARIVVQPATPLQFPLNTRVLAGAGLQTLFRPTRPVAPFNSPVGFIGTITSSDPSKVLLSLDPISRGTAQVSATAPQRLDGIYVQALAAEGVVNLIAEEPDGRRREIPVYLFPSTMALRPSDSNTDQAAIQTLRVSSATPSLTLFALPYLVDPVTGRIFYTDGLSIRGGTDPFFLRAQSLNSAVLQVQPPDALINEGAASARLQFRPIAAGEAEIRLTQPAGFLNVPDASLRVRVLQP